jgi:hypothetical protein
VQGKRLAAGHETHAMQSLPRLGSGARSQHARHTDTHIHTYTYTAIYVEV